MITVNLFADLFDWDAKTTERAQRSYGVSRSLYSIARVGKAGASPMVFVEAGIAFLDAVGSYADYKQAQSKTRELEAEGQALATMLTELKKQVYSQARVRKADTDTNLRGIRETFVEEDEKLNIGVMELTHFAHQIKRFGEHIAMARLDSPLNCLHLLTLERAYYRLVDTQLDLALRLVDE